MGLEHEYYHLLKHTEICNTDKEKRFQKYTHTVNLKPGVLLTVYWKGRQAKVPSGSTHRQYLNQLTNHLISLYTLRLIPVTIYPGLVDTVQINFPLTENSSTVLANCVFFKKYTIWVLSKCSNLQSWTNAH